MFNVKIITQLLILLFLVMVATPLQAIDYRAEMKQMVAEIHASIKSFSENAIIIAQNATPLILDRRGKVDRSYLNSIDGIGIESLNYSWSGKDRPRQYAKERNKLLKHAQNAGKTIFVIDYSPSTMNVYRSFRENQKKGYVTFVSMNRKLNKIPRTPVSPFNAHLGNVHNLKQVRNFLYLINPERYKNVNQMVKELSDTDFDMLVLDPYCHSHSLLSKKDLQQLKKKKNGGKRIVLAYLSIGEGEDYRYYWQKSWNKQKPKWLGKENPDWPGNFKVEYWHDEWKEIIFRGKNSYLTKIMNAGFDGIYMDRVDAWRQFEEKKK
jgi:cysteinyl-tRNA synthetase